ncbi:hypothetical protein MJO28_011718 [Puccinia striiformis f. sp. tritici]|nr:hypothetical protein Pst134EB_022173 [Puccinia striiformis f. sp. tritici]KAI7944190.1 hypothetical protein MJO28_011718 [Puccinia striiformis f. sp. tritici]
MLSDIVFDKMYCVLNYSSLLILQLRLSTETWKEQTVKLTPGGACSTTPSPFKIKIEETIRWLNGCELDLVRQHWPASVRSINGILAEFSLWTDPAYKIEQEKLFAKILYARKISGLSPSEPALQLAQSLIPLIKLSRLFFKKSSGWKLNAKRLPLFTQMSSNQLEHLDACSRHCSKIIAEFQVIVVLKPLPRVFPCDHHIQMTNQLKTHSETTFFSIVTYFVLDNRPVEDYRAWLVDWYTAFNLTIRNFTKKVISCGMHHPRPG